MVAIELIGNIGADVKVVNNNGKTFATFNVCDNRKVGNQEVSQWYTCNLNSYSDKLLQYLKKGQNVFVRGIPVYRIFDSAVHRCKMVGVSILVNDITLVGAAPQSNEADPVETHPTEKPSTQNSGDESPLPF